MLSLYLHIPFCVKKCDYCAFSSFQRDSSLYLDYADSLKQELQALAKKAGERKLASLFIGGGTPTVLPCAVLSNLIGCCLAIFPGSGDAEITVEANPGTVDVAYFQGLLQSGVNRISLGVQSFNDIELSILGRLHSSESAVAAIRAAKNAGFSNINFDLMYGLPGQTVGSWSSTLELAFDLKPQHLSIYQLTVEEGTVLHRRIQANLLELPKEDEVIQMDEVTSASCLNENLVQYEISSFARPGYLCSHNINYWKNEEYYACGSSAVSCVAGVREKRVIDPEEYVYRTQKGLSLIVERERLTPEASFRETVIMGLRMINGVSLHRLVERYHLDPVVYYGDTLKKLIGLGLLEISESNLKLTVKGWPLANLVMSELV